MIKQAPWTIGFSALILTVAATTAIYIGLFKESASRKDDLIRTLQGQLEAAKKTPSGSPLQAPSTTGEASSKGDGNVVNTGKIGTANTQIPLPKK